MNPDNQKGISLLLTLLVMAAILVIALGVSRLSLGEIKLSRDISKSIIAYYAADLGVERALYEKRKNNTDLDIPDCSILLDNGSEYGVKLTSVGEEIFVKSIGCYKGITRAIEVSF